MSVHHAGRARVWIDGRVMDVEDVAIHYVQEHAMAYSPMFCSTGPMNDGEQIHLPGSLPHVMAQLQVAMRNGMISVDEFRQAVSNLVAGVGEPVADPARAPAVEPEHRRAIKLTGDLP